MRSLDVDHILDIYNKKDYSNHFVDFNLKHKKLKTLTISSFSEFDFVKELINKELKQIDENYEVSEFITLLKYENGDFFNLHIDASSYKATNTTTTILSGGCLLNTDYIGGDFIINKKLLDIKIGELFYFGRTEPHEITKVTNGIRLSLHFAVNTSYKEISLI